MLRLCEALGVKIKRVYMLKAADRDSVVARLDKLRHFVASGDMPDGVSVRAYTSREDAALIIETWVFDSADHEKAVAPRLAGILAEMRPEGAKGSYSNELGGLSDRDAVYWDD